MPLSDQDSVPSLPPQPQYRWPLLVPILLLATGLRLWELGRESYWYDEIVTIRLASQPNPLALIRELGRIDASRAPLHPLLLQGWVRLFGPGEAAARALSVVFGVATVAAIIWIGRLAAGDRTGLWSGALAAWSPLLVQYSREARMYAWLVLVTCLAWGILLSFQRSVSRDRLVAYTACLIALVYSHPLGLLMIVALVTAYWSERKAYRFTTRQWVMIHAVASLVCLPWIGRYFDHEPEFVTGRLPLSFLIGTPIGFVGGNKWVLFACVALIIWGGWPRGDEPDDGNVVDPGEPTPHPGPPPQGGREEDRKIGSEPLSSSLPPCGGGPGWGVSESERVGRPSSRGDSGASRRFLIPLLAWLLLPPIILFAYSWVGQPIFGPARYTLFVAPAFLILIGIGLARLPIWLAVLIGIGLAGIAGLQLSRTVYAPGLKADWRGAARKLEGDVPVVVLTDLPGRNLEVETARYYLGAPRIILPAEAIHDLEGNPARNIWVAIGLRDGRPIASPPKNLWNTWVRQETARFPGLELQRWTRVRPDTPR